MMKKTYSRPDICFEDFSLSTNIAAGCEEKPFNHTEWCGVKWGKKDILFGDGFLNCTKNIMEGDSEFNGLCYHNPNVDQNVFFS